MAELPAFLRKKKTVEITPITGTEEINELIEPDEPDEPEDKTYTPVEINDDEIEDLGDALADYILDFMEKNQVNPLPGDQPVNWRKAADLCTIAATQANVGFLLNKQEECDKLEVEPWWTKYIPLFLLIGGFFCLAALILVLGNYAMGMVHH